MSTPLVRRVRLLFISYKSIFTRYRSKMKILSVTQVMDSIVSVVKSNGDSNGDSCASVNEVYREFDPVSKEARLVLSILDFDVRAHLAGYRIVQKIVSKRYKRAPDKVYFVLDGRLLNIPCGNFEVLVVCDWVGTKV